MLLIGEEVVDEKINNNKKMIMTMMMMTMMMMMNYLIQDSIEDDELREEEVSYSLLIQDERLYHALGYSMNEELSESMEIHLILVPLTSCRQTMDYYYEYYEYYY